MMDQYIFKIAVSNPEECDTDKFLETLYKERSVMKDAINDGTLEVPKVEWCKTTDLEYNPRTGKLKVILDKRK